MHILNTEELSVKNQILGIINILSQAEYFTEEYFYDLAQKLNVELLNKVNIINDLLFFYGIYTEELRIVKKYPNDDISERILGYKFLSEHTIAINFPEDKEIYRTEQITEEDLKEIVCSLIYTTWKFSEDPEFFKSEKGKTLICALHNIEEIFDLQPCWDTVYEC